MAELSTLQQREDEYRRMNEEMEKKTAILMQEAEHMLRKHEALLTEEPKDKTAISNEDSKKNPGTDSLMAAVNLEVNDEAEFDELATFNGATYNRRILLSATEKANPDVCEEEIEKTANGRKSAPLSNHKQIEQDVGDGIPMSAHQMGIEAQLRFFKAKVRVLQEELDRSQHELALRSREADSLDSKLQEATEERNRFTRQVASLQQTLTKQKKLADDNESRASALERSLEAAKREADSAKRENKKSSSDKSAYEVRLNRAVEEAEHLRQELAKARATVREANHEETKKVEKMSSDIRKLERQRTELIAAFKKSLKLVDVLKRQKLHLEAARLLQFREEDFVRALDWDKQTAPSQNLHSVPSSSRSKATNSSRRITSSNTLAKGTSTATNNKIPLNAIVEGIGANSFSDVIDIDENGN